MTYFLVAQHLLQFQTWIRKNYHDRISWLIRQFDLSTVHTYVTKLTYYELYFWYSVSGIMAEKEPEEKIETKDDIEAHEYIEYNEDTIPTDQIPESRKSKINQIISSLYKLILVRNKKKTVGVFCPIVF